MMAEDDLLDIFINTLYKKINTRSELVHFIADTLMIEKVSASRRLNKKVYFSINEMGILSRRLGISLDSLLLNDNQFSFTAPYRLISPMSYKSINSLVKKIETIRNQLNDLYEYGAFFSFPPIEFLAPYPNLSKFAYFKWGYYHVNSDEFSKFSLWKMPDEIIQINSWIMDIYNKLEKVLYIWDISTICDFVRDINYMHSIYLLDERDIKHLKNELHEMLNSIEQVADGYGTSGLLKPEKIELYVSNVHSGADYSYFISSDKGYCNFRNFFIESNYSDDYNSCIQIRQWMNSLKKVSTLISESGIRERKIFFKEQHSIVDTLEIPVR